MKHRILILLLSSVAATAGTAAAAPPARGPAPQHDGFHVTITAGRGRLGMAAIQISPELRTHLGAPADRGVLVDTVRPDSPAARAGLLVGDVVLDVDGRPVRSAGDVLEAMSGRAKGETVTIVALRNGRETTLQTTLDSDAGPTWRSLGGTSDLTPFGFGDAEMQRMFDDVRRRMKELERRMYRLERI